VFDSKRLAKIRGELWPMWQSLAKNEHERVDRRSLRYAVHRFLLHKYSISIIGLEPLHANGSHEEAQLLTKYMPSYVRTVLEGKAARHGFSLDDAVAMIVTLERLVEDSSWEIVANIYRMYGLDSRDWIRRDDVNKVMEGFMLRWMLGDDTESIQALESNETLKYESFEDWRHIAFFAKGRIDSFEYARTSAMQSETWIRQAGSLWSPLERRFSFTDVQAIGGQVSTTFGRFWETECQRVKAVLDKMDKSANGRVKLSDFHAAALAGEWRFSESKEYLRQLGALDETSSWYGPQVITTNYLQSPSNCIVYSPHYRVCCANECESVLGAGEEAVASPMGLPEEILTSLANITVTFEDDHLPTLKGSLTQQLQEIATVNGGKVPLHGRLFAQWLHYAFPSVCPFPHKAGTTSTLAPLEFGSEYIASDEELESHSVEAEEDRQAATHGAPAGGNPDDWMSQWSPDEELLTDSLKLEAPWSPARVSSKLIGGAFLAVLGFVFRDKIGFSTRLSKEDVMPMNMVKSHWV
jgi:hypothetical protein